MLVVRFSDLANPRTIRYQPLNCLIGLCVITTLYEGRYEKSAVSAVLLLLSGCVKHGNTVTMWDKDDMTEKQFKLDLADCDFQAKANTEEGLYSEKAAEERYRELRDMCLKSKGYHIVSKEFQANDGEVISLPVE